jgi:outer membrane protein assembly factor BamB
LSSWGGRFVAIRSFDGVEKFAWNAGLYPSSGAASDSDGNIYSLRAVEGSGVELVKVSTDGKETIMFRQEESRRGARRTLVWASPVLDEVAKIIYFVINHDRGAILYAFSMVADRVLWKSVLPISVQPSPVLSGDGLITLFDLRGMTLCFTVEGSLKYNYYTGCEYLVAAGAADISGTIYLGDTQGKIHVIDENGKGKVILETERSIQARPAFSPTGDLFIPSTDHNVYVFRNAG